jgi:protoporphyrinogen/coproporphyrinogen III oxidase
MDVRPEIYDCIIVGGGLAGLCAAYRLRSRSILVLEAADRPGGRIESQPRGDYWLNFGAHMFGGPGTPIGDLLAELGLESRPIGGALLGMSLAGRRLLSGAIETYPLRLPLPLAARISMVKMGLALRRGASRTVKALAAREGETPDKTRARTMAFENDRTLSAMIGRLHPDIANILTAITERTGGDPSEMAAGYALRSFTNVWSQHSPGRNLLGGSSGLPGALAKRLDGRLLCGNAVQSVGSRGEEIVVAVTSAGGIRQLRAKTAIVATPAFVTRQIIRGLPPATANALAGIRYGAFLSAAVLTGETGAMPWDRNYAISTPRRSFSVLFNQATTLRSCSTRRPGGSLMLFRGAKGAKRLCQGSDAAIEAAFAADLIAEFPESRGIVREIVIRRWDAGAPYAFPGRAGLQSALTASLGRIALAGDYLDFPNMEAAAATGFEAAGKVVAMLRCDTDDLVQRPDRTLRAFNG